MRSTHDDPLAIGLFIPFAPAYQAVKEFIESDGEPPKSIEWIANKDLPPNTFPEPWNVPPGAETNQIPTYEEGDLALFETGSIVVHIAQRHAGLLPDDANARARAITWMFAALNTVEPPILELGTARLLEGDKPWHDERLPLVEDRVRNRLKQLSARLGDADWLDGAFSAGDLMMVSVLLRLKASGLLDEFPNLAAYLARGEARPAYKRAFAAQLAINTGKLPTD